MSELTAVLSSLAVILTLIGTFRLAAFFFNGSIEVAVLIGVAFTTIFLFYYQQIVFLFGLVTIAAPIAGGYILYQRRPDYFPTTGLGSSGSGSSGSGSSGSGSSGSGSSGSGSSGSGSSGSGSSGSGGGQKSNTGQQVKCTNCGRQYDPDKTFCDDCGYKLGN
jgi:ribosomal protein L37E